MPTLEVPRVECVEYGKTGINVSRLTFGTIPFGGMGWRKDPAVSPEEGGQILKRALKLGINCWDTAEGYGTHPHIREGLRGLRRSDVIVATKTHAKTLTEVRERIRRSLEGMDTDYIDIYYLHYINSVEEYRARFGALRALQEAKDEDLIRLIGVSTHTAEVLNAVSELPEVDVVLAKVNKTGRGMESRLDDMLSALKKVYESGKGVSIMKILAYGDLDVTAGLQFSLNLPYVHSICLGMRTVQELEVDVRIFQDLSAGC